MNTESLSRRTLIAGAASVAAAAAVPTATSAQQERVITNGRIRQSVCQWCYGRIPLEELAAAASAMGLESIEILGPEAFPTLQKHGLSCAMTNSHGIAEGINDPANHEACLEAITAAIDATAEAGFPNVITFSGNRNGMPDGEGLENCVTALKQVVGHAEQKGVTICMELLNSKVNHADYMADNMPWRTGRGPGAVLPGDHARDPGDRLHGHRGPGIHPQERRQARCPGAWRERVRRVKKSEADASRVLPEGRRGRRRAQWVTARTESDP